MTSSVGERFDFAGQMLSVQNADKATCKNTIIYDAAKKAFFVPKGTYSDFIDKEMRVKVTKEDGTTEIFQGKVSVRTKEHKAELLTKIKSLQTEAMKLHKKTNEREKELHGSMSKREVKKLETDTKKQTTVERVAKVARKKRKGVLPTFTYGGQTWVRNKTKGDGFCAVHALLGTPNAKGVLEWTGKRNEIGDLFKVNKERLRDHFQAFFEGLVQSRKVDEYDLPLKKALKDDLDQCSRQLAQLNQDERAFFDTEYAPQRFALIDTLVKAMDPDQRKDFAAQFYRDGTKTLDLRGAINTSYQNMLSWMREKGATFGECLTKLSQLDEKLADLQRQRANLLNSLIDQCFDRYLERFQDRDYFLTHHELEMVAELKGKQVLLLNRDRMDQPVSSSTTVIWWEGNHFERCSPNREEVEVEE